jgi:hypothetical protein
MLSVVYSRLSAVRPARTSLNRLVQITRLGPACYAVCLLLFSHIAANDASPTYASPAPASRSAASRGAAAGGDAARPPQYGQAGAHARVPQLLGGRQDYAAAHQVRLPYPPCPRALESRCPARGKGTGPGRRAPSSSAWCAGAAHCAGTCRDRRSRARRGARCVRLALLRLLQPRSPAARASRVHSSMRTYKSVLTNSLVEETHHMTLYSCSTSSFQAFVKFSRRKSCVSFWHRPTLSVCQLRTP